MKKNTKSYTSKLLGNFPKGLFSVLVVCAILWLTLAPHPLPEHDDINIPGLDKIVHAAMFGGMYFALAFDRMLFRHGKTGMFSADMPRRSMIAFAVVTIVFGGAIEFLQEAMALGRGGETVDFVADIAGVFVSIWLSPIVLRCMQNVL